MPCLPTKSGRVERVKAENKRSEMESKRGERKSGEGECMEATKVFREAAGVGNNLPNSRYYMITGSRTLKRTVCTRYVWYIRDIGSLQKLAQSTRRNKYSTYMYDNGLPLFVRWPAHSR